MVKDYTYDLWILDAAGDRTSVLSAEKKASRVRRVAKNIKERPGRRVLIERDGKKMPGGSSGLDTELYQVWLEQHAPEDEADQKPSI